MIKYSQSAKLMGNNFTITLIASDCRTAKYNIECAINEIKRIETLFTTYNDSSETNRINFHAGIRPITVSEEVYKLIERSIRISEITQGAFDITYGGLNKNFWNFNTTMTTLPDKVSAKGCVQLINYKNIILNQENRSVFLKDKGMRIGFGGIAKGYAAEMAKQVLQKNDISSGIINASGDLTTWGKQENGKSWTIGIANPDHPESAFSCIQISDMAVATSGNYEKFVIIDGKKYSHTIDPKTGYPVAGIKSVTVIGNNAELADALATPVSVMGKEAGLYLINQLPGFSCIIIDDSNTIYTSKNINIK